MNHAQSSSAEDAASACDTADGFLASPDGLEEARFLTSLSSSTFWIGYKYDEDVGMLNGLMDVINCLYCNLESSLKNKIITN